MSLLNAFLFIRLSEKNLTLMIRKNKDDNLIWLIKTTNYDFFQIMYRFGFSLFAVIFSSFIILNF